MKLKILITVVFFTGMIFSANAQTRKGSFLLSGATGLQFTGGKADISLNDSLGVEITRNYFSFSPGMAYFFMNNVAIGLSADFSHDKTDYDMKFRYISSTSKDIKKKVAIVPTLYYIFPLESPVRPFLQAGVGWSYLSTKTVDMHAQESEIIYKGMALALAGGAAWFVTENISLNTGIAYARSWLKDPDTEGLRNNQYNVTLSMGISVFF